MLAFRMLRRRALMGKGLCWSMARPQSGSQQLCRHLGVCVGRVGACHDGAGIRYLVLCCVVLVVVLVLVLVFVCSAFAFAFIFGLARRSGCLGAVSQALVPSCRESVVLGTGAACIALGAVSGMCNAADRASCMRVESDVPLLWGLLADTAKTPDWAVGWPDARYLGTRVLYSRAI